MGSGGRRKIRGKVKVKDEGTGEKVVRGGLRRGGYRSEGGGGVAGEAEGEDNNVKESGRED